MAYCLLDSFTGALEDLALLRFRHVPPQGQDRDGRWLIFFSQETQVAKVSVPHNRTIEDRPVEALIPFATNVLNP